MERYPDLISASVTSPRRWSPGVALVPKSEYVLEIHDAFADAHCQPNPSLQEHRHERAKAHVPTDVKAWFVEFRALQFWRNGWSMLETLRCVHVLYQSSFCKIRQNTPRRWKDQMDRLRGGDETRGRHRRPTEAEVSIVAAVCRGPVQQGWHDDNRGNQHRRAGVEEVRRREFDRRPRDVLIFLGSTRRACQRFPPSR